jgi:NMT1-like family
MKPIPQLLRENTLLYRIKRYPASALLSLALVIIFTFLICYMLNKVYPELKLFAGILPQKAINYNFYTGIREGTYHTIGKKVEGKFTATGDSVINCETKGGYENAMNVIIQKNSFGLIQEELISQNDPLRKNVRFISPLFLERMHIFYRKEIFRYYKGPIQLSANTDPGILRRLSDSVDIINPGLVGSGTRILSSYILTLIGQQIEKRLGTFPKYTQVDIPPSRSFKMMLDTSASKDTIIDIMLYVSADPLERVKTILDSGKYALMSIDPSLTVQLNKEFNLSLRIADFKGKYEKTRQISTIGTLAYLIGSKAIRDDAVFSFLFKIDSCRTAINKGLTNDTAANKSPLNEFGFFNAFSDDYTASKKFKWKELAAFILSVVTLFFPAFRSVSSIKSVFKSWSVNRQIDEALKIRDRSERENQHLGNYEMFETLSEIREKLIDMYGDGILPELRFNALMKRVSLYLEKFPAKDPGLSNYKVIRREDYDNPVKA